MKDEFSDEESQIWKLGQIDIIYALKTWFGFNPHDAQKQIIFGLDQVTTIVAGRRFGKSVLMAALALYYAITKKKSIQFIISPSQDQSKIIFNELKEMALESPLVAPLVEKTKDFPFPEIRFKSGALIYARSTGNNEGKYLRGHKAHRIILDEAAYIKESIITNVISPMLADYDGEMIQISTPLGQNHFYDSHQRGLIKEPGYASFQFSSFENPHISHSYIRRKQKEITDIEFRTEWLAEFVDDQVCVFKWATINDALVDYEETYEPEPSHNYFIGVDIAKMYDYTAIVVIDGTDQKNCKVVYTERYTGKPYSFVIERIMGLSFRFHPLSILLDETGVGAGITEQVAAELPCAEGFTFSMQSKVALINTLKTGLEQRRLKIPRSQNVMADELRFYQYELSDSGVVKMSAPSKKHDDYVIALALAYQKCAVMYADASVDLIERNDDSEHKDLNTSDFSVSNISSHSSDFNDDQVSGVKWWI